MVQYGSGAGIANQAGHFDEVACDDGDSGLEVVEELVGQAPSVVLGLGLVEAESKVGRLGVALKLFARNPSHKAHIRPALTEHVLLKSRDCVAAADHHELHLRAQGCGFDEFLSSSVDVDSGALEDPKGLIHGEAQFPTDRKLVLRGGRPLAVGTPWQVCSEGHVADDVPGSAVLAGVLVGDARVDGHAKIGARNSVALHPPPKTLHHGARLELRSPQKVLMAVVDKGLRAAHRPPSVRCQGVEVVGEVDVRLKSLKCEPQPYLVFEVEQGAFVRPATHALGFVGAIQRGWIGIGSADNDDSVPALGPKRRCAVYALVAVQVVDDAQYYGRAHAAKVAQPSFERTLRI